MKKITICIVLFCLYINVLIANSKDTILHCNIYTIANKEMEIAMDKIIDRWINCTYFQYFQTFPMLLVQIYDEGCDLEIYPYSKTLHTRFSVDDRINHSGYILLENALVVIHDFSDQFRINDYFTCEKKEQTIHLFRNSNLIDHYFPPFNEYYEVHYDIFNGHLLNEDCAECTDKDNPFEFLYLVKNGDTWESIANNLNLDATILRQSFYNLGYRELFPGFLMHFMCTVNERNYTMVVYN